MPGDRSRTAVLCVHGIQGSPDQFHWIIRALPKHTDVYNLLLPGHGADVRSFRQSGMTAWQACVDEKIRELSKEYDSILYIGHSMGCLLGIDACIRLESNVQALVLLACPLALRPSFRYVRNNFCAAAGICLNNPFVAAARAGNSVQAKSLFSYLSCVRPNIQLLGKMRSVGKVLPSLELPVTAIHSETDEIVSKRSLNFFKPLPHAQLLTVPGSGHYLYNPEAQDLILCKILERLESI